MCICVCVAAWLYLCVLYVFRCVKVCLNVADFTEVDAAFPIFSWKTSILCLRHNLLFWKCVMKIDYLLLHQSQLPIRPDADIGIYYKTSRKGYWSIAKIGFDGLKLRCNTQINRLNSMYAMMVLLWYIQKIEMVFRWKWECYAAQAQRATWLLHALY